MTRTRSAWSKIPWWGPARWITLPGIKKRPPRAGRGQSKARRSRAHQASQELAGGRLLHHPAESSEGKPANVSVLAAIDIGSNSVRLKVARIVHHRLKTVHDERFVTRLGDSVFREGALSPEAMDATIKVLRRFHGVVQSYGNGRVGTVGRRIAAAVSSTIATSGTAAALAGATQAVEPSNRGAVARPAVWRLAEELSQLDVDGRSKWPGIGPRRAEIIVAGAYVFAEL